MARKLLLAPANVGNALARDMLAEAKHSREFPSFLPCINPSSNSTRNMKMTTEYVKHYFFASKLSTSLIVVSSRRLDNYPDNILIFRFLLVLVSQLYLLHVFVVLNIVVGIVTNLYNTICRLESYIQRDLYLFYFLQSSSSSPIVLRSVSVSESSR